MDQSACKLTLVYPPEAEDALVELLLTVEPPLTGFTTVMVDGHGHDFLAASVRERVRGRVKRGVLSLVLARTRVAALLEEIRTKAPIASLSYWVEPVDAFGRLEPVETAAAA